MGRVIQNDNSVIGGLYSPLNAGPLIQEVKNFQVELIKIQKEIRKLVKKFDKDLTEYVQKEWDKTFPGLKVWFLSGCECGLTNNWESYVFFYSIDEKDMFDGKVYDTAANDLPRGQVRQVKCPVSMARLKAFLKRMNQETGATCQLSDCNYIGKCLRENVENAE